ncbi:hypothetical protein [Sediminibacillus albus]|nr:hypothetical protein [Sediminibacillus albus]
MAIDESPEKKLFLTNLTVSYEERRQLKSTDVDPMAPLPWGDNYSLLGFRLCCRFGGMSCRQGSLHVFHNELTG